MRTLSCPLAPCTQGERVRVRGFFVRCHAPSPRPSPPEYRGRGGEEHTAMIKLPTIAQPPRMKARTRMKIGYGRESLNIDVPAESLVAVHRAPFSPPLSDPAAAVREAL